MKLVAEQKQWNIVLEELEKENIKIMSYDNKLIELFGNLNRKKILDYGAGPAVLESELKKLGAYVKTFDISEEMNNICRQKIGSENVYSIVNELPKNKFDIIICNLVLCIVEEDEVKNILRNIKNALNQKGFAFIGVCNPKIFYVPESRLDFRKQTGNKYEENHVYKKIKKEGTYEIHEIHRPIEWYEKTYKELGLNLVEIIFTPEYEFKGRKIQDFVIFKIAKS